MGELELTHIHPPAEKVYWLCLSRSVVVVSEQPHVRQALSERQPAGNYRKHDAEATDQ